MTIAYHVAPADHTGNLESLYKLHGEDAYDMYATRWPESGNLGQVHAHYVHLYDTLAEAQAHVHDGIIYAVDLSAMGDDCISIERDRDEFDHPMIRNEIDAAYLTVIA